MGERNYKATRKTSRGETEKGGDQQLVWPNDLTRLLDRAYAHTSKRNETISQLVSFPANSTHASIAAARAGSVAEGYREAADEPDVATAFGFGFHNGAFRFVVRAFRDEREMRAGQRVKRVVAREMRARHSLSKYVASVRLVRSRAASLGENAYCRASNRRDDAAGVDAP